LSINTILSKKSLSFSEFVSSSIDWQGVHEILKTYPRMRFQLAVWVKLKMNVLAEIHSQKAKMCQPEPT